ncbi:hypothetical protein EXIGLDRAFT_833333, partial [Exidia glandulosa HHB12029]
MTSRSRSVSPPPRSTRRPCSASLFRTSTSSRPASIRRARVHSRLRSLFPTRISSTARAHTCSLRLCCAPPATRTSTPSARTRSRSPSTRPSHESRSRTWTLSDTYPLTHTFIYPTHSLPLAHRAVSSGLGTFAVTVTSPSWMSYNLRRIDPKNF